MNFRPVPLVISAPRLVVTPSKVLVLLPTLVCDYSPPTSAATALLRRVKNAIAVELITVPETAVVIRSPVDFAHRHNAMIPMKLAARTAAFHLQTLFVTNPQGPVTLTLRVREIHRSARLCARARTASPAVYLTTVMKQICSAFRVSAQVVICNAAPY